MVQARSLLPALLRASLTAGMLGGGLTAATRPAQAQAIAAVVNGDPITTTEVEEQMRFRRILKQPADRNSAEEDLIADRLKLRAANREGIDATDAGFTQTLSRLAAQAKMNSQELLGALQQQKLNIDLVRTHVRSLSAWDEFVKARYKALSVSEQDVTAALNKDAGLAKAATDYTLQQIVFVVPVKATPADIDQRMREAESLRTRFTDCASGVPMARALPNVAIKPPVNKLESSLNENSRKALSQTQKGRLTPPQRSAAGIEMFAVCNRDDDPDRTTVRDTVQANLLTDRLSKEADRMYKELRARAVVDKR